MTRMTIEDDTLNDQEGVRSLNIAVRLKYENKKKIVCTYVPIDMAQFMCMCIDRMRSTWNLSTF